MKKYLLSICAGLMFLAASAAEPVSVSEKVLKAFSESFKNVQNVTWSATSETYEVYFIQDEVKSRVRYDAEGNIVQTIRYYGADKLPIMVNSKLSKRFADKKVFGVTEISNGESITYRIVLEDAKHWTHVEADAFGNLFIDKKYKKA